MEVGPVWESVLEQTKSAQDKSSDPLVWAVQLSSRLNSAGVSLPSIDLAHLLVSHICWDNHLPITWKFLEKALTANFVPPILVLALLSTRSVSLLLKFGFRIYGLRPRYPVGVEPAQTGKALDTYFLHISKSR